MPLLLYYINITTTNTNNTIAAVSACDPRHAFRFLNVVPQSGKKHRLVKLFIGKKKKKIMKKEKKNEY